MTARREVRAAIAALGLFAIAACSSADADKTAESATSAGTPAPAPLPALSPEFEAVRADLDRFKDPIVAIREGYFSSVGCIDFPTGVTEGGLSYKPGAMGVHFINMGYIAPVLDPKKPQVLLYEWQGDRLVLTAAEWFMPLQLSKTAPTVLGQTLEGPMEGHPPILPQELHHWDLHVWLWKENPNGLMHSTNPAVKCAPGPYTFADHQMKAVHPH
jgi:hypothetical protein